MPKDATNSWMEKTKSPAGGRLAAPVSKGQVILDMAEKLRPWLMNVFTGLRDENGMLLQPARIRAIALNVAQDIVMQQEKKHS